MPCLGGCIDHMVVAISWHSLIIVITCAVTTYILAVVAVSSSSKAIVVCVVRCVLVLAEVVLSRYSSARCYGMGSIHGGWLLVVGFGWVRLALCGCMSPIGGRCRIRALWSPNSGVCGVVYRVVLWCVWVPEEPVV